MSDTESTPEPIPPEPSWRISETLPAKPSARPNTIVRFATTGFRIFNWITLPIALLALIVGLVPTAFGLGTGRGFGLYEIATYAVVGYFLAISLGLLIGTTLGLFAALRGKAGPDSAWAKANRPIGFFRKRKSKPVVEKPTLEDGWDRPRPSHWPWILRACAVVGVLVLGAAFGIGVYAGRDVDRRLAAEIEATTKEDPNWRLEDLLAAREKVPDDENSALVVAKAVKKIPPEWPSTPREQPWKPIPPPSEAKLAVDFLNNEVGENVRLDDEAAATLRGELQRLDDAVKLARTVANYARGRHEIKLKPNLMEITFLETSNARKVSRLLQVDAAMRAHDGDIDGALDSCSAIFGVARSIGDEPFLISGLVRIAINGDAIKSTVRVLGQGEPSDQALAKLQAIVLKEISYPLLIQGMKGERGLQDGMLRRMADSEVSVESLAGGMAVADPVPRIPPWTKLFLENQRAIGLDWMRDLIALCEQPTFKRPPLIKAWEDKMERARQSALGKLTTMIPYLLMPAMKVAIIAHSRGETELGALAIVIAAERHRRKTGQWPASIAEIDPAILPSAPLDPFSGRPYLLERDDGRFLVHSIGPDLKDDQGLYVPKLWMRGGPDDVGSVVHDVSLRKQAPQE